jgi:hypothetical protein
MEVLMNTDPGPAASGEVYLNFENVSATMDHIKEASAWCRDTRGTNSSFWQAMKSRGNPLADWSKGQAYPGLKKGSSNPDKDQIADYLDAFLFRFLQELLGPDDEETFPEGSSRQMTVNRYERDPKARKKCLAYWGFNCIVCGFSFEERYGPLGHEYIHVHHLRELSTVPPGYQVNPKKDLVPICPNCHAMIHRESPAVTPDELKQRIQKISTAVQLRLRSGAQRRAAHSLRHRPGKRIRWRPGSRPGLVWRSTVGARGR